MKRYATWRLLRDRPGQRSATIIFTSLVSATLKRLPMTQPPKKTKRLTGCRLLRKPTFLWCRILKTVSQWDTPLAPNEYLNWIPTFINRIKSNSGLYSMLYSRKSYFHEKLPSYHDPGKYKLWIPDYSTRDCNKVICPEGWSYRAMWQYCEDGVIGSNAKLDINILKDQTLF